jgi:hypothetical protein
VLHIGCGAGGLTKMMASQGIRVLGVDAGVEAATTRGLAAVPYAGEPLAPGSLQGALAHAGEAFDAAVILDSGCFKCAGALAPLWPSAGALAEIGWVPRGPGRAGAPGCARAAPPWGPASGRLLRRPRLRCRRSALKQGGRLCVETTLPPAVSQAAAKELLAAGGYEVLSWEQLSEMPRIRMVARKL